MNKNSAYHRGLRDRGKDIFDTITGGGYHISCRQTVLSSDRKRNVDGESIEERMDEKDSGVSYGTLQRDFESRIMCEDKI